MESPLKSGASLSTMLGNSSVDLSNPAKLHDFRETLAAMVGQYSSHCKEQGHDQKELDILQKAQCLINPHIEFNLAEPAMQTEEGSNAGASPLPDPQEEASAGQEEGVIGLPTNPEVGSSPNRAEDQTRSTSVSQPKRKRARTDDEIADQELSPLPAKRRRTADENTSPLNKVVYYWEDVFEKDGAKQLRSFMRWSRSSQGADYRAARQEVLDGVDSIRAPSSIRQLVGAYQLQALGDPAKTGNKGLQHMDLARFGSFYQTAVIDAEDETSALRQEFGHAGLGPSKDKTWQDVLDEQLIRYGEGIDVRSDSRPKRVTAPRRRMKNLLTRAESFHIVERALGRGVFPLLKSKVAPRFLESRGDKLSTIVRTLAEWIPKTRIVSDHITSEIIDPLLRGEELASIRLEGTNDALDDVILNELLELVEEA